jgi:inosose dehydratase
MTLTTPFQGPVRIGIAPIGWTNDDWPDLGGDIPLEQCLGEMAEAGYEGCEVGGKFPRHPETLRQILEPFSLQVASGWLSLWFTDAARREETIDAYREHCGFLRAMGASVVVVAECGRCVQQGPLALSADRPRFDDREWSRLVEGLHRIGEIARGQGMTNVYHPHVGTGVQSAEDVDRLMAATDPPLVSLLLDTGHATLDGHDPRRIIRDHAARIRHVHLKDVRGAVASAAIGGRWSFERAVRAGVFTVPGDGEVDMRGVVEDLAKAGYSGWMIVEAEQDPGVANPLQYAKMGRDFLKQELGL